MDNNDIVKNGAVMYIKHEENK